MPLTPFSPLPTPEEPRKNFREKRDSCTIQLRQVWALDWNLRVGDEIIHHQKKKKNLHRASQFTEHFLFHSCSWSSHLFWAVLGGVCFFSLSHWWGIWESEKRHDCLRMIHLVKGQEDGSPNCWCRSYAFSILPIIQPIMQSFPGNTDHGLPDAVRWKAQVFPPGNT